MSSHPFKRLLGDRALLESLLAAIVITIATAGLSVVLAWLWVLRWALVRDRAPARGAVLVFGHRLTAGRVSADYRARLSRAARALSERSNLQLVLLGGGQPSEAAAGRDWLREHAGIADERLRLEEDSIDSYENLRNARELINDARTVYLLSNRYHLGRLRLFAGQLGIRSVPIPAEPRRRQAIAMLPQTLLEAVWVSWFLSGRFWARLAKRRALLDRLN